MVSSGRTSGRGPVGPGLDRRKSVSPATRLRPQPRRTARTRPRGHRRRTCRTRSRNTIRQADPADPADPDEPSGSTPGRRSRSWSWRARWAGRPDEEQVAGVRPAGHGHGAKRTAGGELDAPPDRDRRDWRLEGQLQAGAEPKVGGERLREVAFVARQGFVVDDDAPRPGAVDDEAVGGEGERLVADAASRPGRGDPPGVPVDSRSRREAIDAQTGSLTDPARRARTSRYAATGSGEPGLADPGTTSDWPGDAGSALPAMTQIWTMHRAASRMESRPTGFLRYTSQ